MRRARKGQRRPEEHRHSRGQKVTQVLLQDNRVASRTKSTKVCGGPNSLGGQKDANHWRFGFARVWNLGSKRPVANHWGLKSPQETGTEFVRNHSPVPPRAPLRPPQKRPEEARAKPEEAGIHAKPQRYEIRAKPQWESRPTACAVAVGNLRWPPRRSLKRPREAGIRAKPQREHRNATEFARNHSGSIETQRNSRETTAGASKPKPRPTARAVAVGNLSGPPKRDLKAEFARNHSGNIEMQRSSRETTATASKRNGIHAKPQRERRKPRPRLTAHAVAVGNLSGPRRRGLKRPRETGIRAKP